MPIYEYMCADCGNAFEELVRSMGEDAKVVCPACGGSAAQRRPSVFAARQASPAPVCPVEGGCGAGCHAGGPCCL